MRFKVAVRRKVEKLSREFWKYKMAAKYSSVEELCELVTEDTADDNLKEDGEYKELDGFKK